MSFLQNHPFSELAPESRWRLAEYYFDSGQLDQALKEYKILSTLKSSTFSIKALYKEGATLYSKGLYPDAAKIFIALYRETSKVLSDSDPEAATLYDEAIDYLAYLKSKNIPLAVDDDTDALISERLAQVYHRVHDEESSRRTYLDYVAGHSLSKTSPHFMNSVIESYEDFNDQENAQKIRNHFIAALGPQSKYWERFSSDVAITVETQDLYERHVLASAEFYANQARGSKRAGDYETAIRYYQKFLSAYPGSPNRVQAIYQIAELQYFSGRFADAAASYSQVLVSTDDSPLRNDAAYSFLLAEAKRINFPLAAREGAQPSRDTNGRLTEPTELTAQEKVFVNAVQFYNSNITEGSRRQKVLYRVAEIFFKHNKFEKCRQFLELLLKDKEVSEVSSGAVRLIAASYDLEGNWEKVNEANRRLMIVTPAADPNAVGMDGPLVVGPLRLVDAGRLESSGSIDEAAALYEQYALLFPKAQDTDFALFRAGLLYRSLTRITASSRIFSKLILDHSESKYASQAEFFMAANEESLIRFNEAATQYEKFSEKYPKHFLAPQALLNAATLRKGLLEFERAAHLFDKYNEGLRDVEVEFEIAHLYQLANQNEKALKIYNRCASGHFGRELFIRGLFERASLTSEAAKDGHSLAQVNVDCATVDAAVHKFPGQISAKTYQAVI